MVAQVIKSQFVIGAVGDVRLIGGPTLGSLRILGRQDHAGGKSQELVNLPHPVGVTIGEVIVDCDDVNAFTGERIQI